MVKDIEVYKGGKTQKLDIEPIMEIYIDTCQYHQLPYLQQIVLGHGSRVEAKIQSFQVSYYPDDDFYDGSPGSVPKNRVPDLLKHSLSEYLGIEINIGEEDIRRVLEDYCMFYIDGHGKIFHAPQVEVW